MLKGIACTVPPALSPDGECNRVINLRYQNDTWIPIGTPSAIYVPSSPDHKIVYIHCNEKYTHYISSDGTAIFYEAYAEEPKTITEINQHIFDTKEKIYSIESIGNTLLFISEKNIYYSIYKEGTYKYLGTKPPLPEITFSLEQTSSNYAVVTGNYVLTDSSGTNYTSMISEYDIKAYSAQVYGNYNKIKTKIHQDKHFCQPFLIRYALKLYDGSYIMPSAPILLSCSEPRQFTQQITVNVDSGKKTFYSTDAYIQSGTLFYKVIKCELEDWKDIVKKIDIFITNEAVVIRDEKIKDYAIKDDNGTRYFTFTMPSYSGEEIGELLSEENLFYKITSLTDFKKLVNTGKNKLVIKDDLESLALLPVLSADNSTLHSLSGKCSYVYNSRLHIGDICKELYNGFPLSVLTCGICGYTETLPVLPPFKQAYICIYIKHSEGDRKLVWSATQREIENLKLSGMLSYPDSRAYKIEIEATPEPGYPLRYRFSAPLKACANENKACYISPDLKQAAWKEIMVSGPFDIPAGDTIIESFPNTLLVSSSRNPFTFPSEETYIVSNGQITGIASTTTPLSQGQYGAFPLYIFTNEGIWALETGENNLCYGISQPVNREIADERHDIIPIDNGIIYISARGISVLSGVSSALLLSFTDNHREELPDCGNIPEEIQGAFRNDTSIQDYLCECQLGYNYVTQELVFLHPLFPYLLILHIPSGNIYRRSGRYSSLYQHFPILLVSDANGIVYDMMQEAPGDVPFALVTRPIKLIPDFYKRWRETSVLCTFDSSWLQLSLWGGYEAEGSFRKLSSFNLAGKIRGHIPFKTMGPPYKYHCISITGVADPTFQLSTIDTRFEATENNHLR